MRFKTMLTCTVFGLGAWTQPALAETQPADAAASPEAIQIDEIVVTARRREEDLQSVPLAVQAFSGEQLEQLNVSNATDLSRAVPALTSAQSSRDEENYVIRAQSGSGASISGQQVTVPTYLSQVPLPIGDGGGYGRYFDLQNIQVLKGPQGTLFGRNSTGGAVLFEPRRPGQEFGGYVEGELGNYEHAQIEGAINIPISSSLSIRAAGFYTTRRGFTQNVTTGQDQDDRSVYSGRLSILFEPSSDFSNLLVADILRSRTNGSSNHLAAVNPNAGIPFLFGGAVQAALAQQNAAGPYVAFSDTPGLNQREAEGFANITTWNVSENITLRNILGYRGFRQVNRFDYDGTALTILNFDTCARPQACNTRDPDSPWGTNIDQWTEEFQIQARLLDNRLNLTVGLFYADTSTPSSNYSHQTSVFGSTTDVNQYVADTSLALYGQATYEFSGGLTGLSMTAGYRRTRDERSLEIYQVSSGRCVTGATGTAVPDPATADICRADFEANFTSDSYTIGLEYDFAPDVMGYIAHRQGYRAGGTNPLAGPALLATPPIPNASALFEYAPETLRDLELGLKASFDIGTWRARTNIAAYYQWLDDAQINQTFSVGTQTVSALVNAATATIQGLEAEITLAPSRDFNFIFAYAYTQAEYGEFLDYSRRDAQNNPTLQSGRIFPFTPRHKFNVGVNWTLPLDDQIGRISIGANLAYKSEIILGLVPFITLPNGTNVFDGESEQEATTTIDLNLNWRGIFQSNFDAGLFISNLTDETYKIGGASLINSGLGINQRVYNEPRMIGVRLRYRFGGG